MIPDVHPPGVAARPPTPDPVTRQRNSQAAAIPALTAIRGLAAWWVVVFHFRDNLPDYAGLGGFADRGYLAVDLFFVLSGFIIALNYLPRFDPPRLGVYAQFLGLRLARIYPLHGFMLLAFLLNPLAIVLTSNTPPDPIRYSLAYYICSVFLVQNWGFMQSLAWNVPAWSISTEWLAYLIFPLVAWLALRAARTAWRAAAMVAIPLLLLASVSAAAGGTLGGEITRYGLLRCLLEFSSGAFLYRFWDATGASRLLAELATMTCAALLLIYILVPVNDYLIFPPAWCCLIYALACRRSVLSRLLAGRTIETIGEYSYSTYLVHYFVRDWVKFLLVRDGIAPSVQLTAYLLTVAAASVVLYRLVEVPGRRRLRSIISVGR